MHDWDWFMLVMIGLLALEIGSLRKHIKQLESDRHHAS